MPLLLAERAWAHAMQLRQEANTEPRKKFHLISRLKKACSHAHMLLQLCEVGSEQVLVCISISKSVSCFSFILREVMTPLFLTIFLL